MLRTANVVAYDVMNAALNVSGCIITLMSVFARIVIPISTVSPPATAPACCVRSVVSLGSAPVEYGREHEREHEREH